MARTPGPAPSCPGGGRAQLSSASPPAAGLLLLPAPTPPPPLLLLLVPLLLFSRLCGALAGSVIVEPHVTAVWGKNVSLKCLIEVNETITQISWEKIHGKSTQTVAVHHPQYGFSVQGDYQGRVLFKNYSLNDATITLHNIGFSDSGKYICKAVTFPLGNAQSSTTVTVLVEPTVSLIKGPDSLIDGGNETVAAICIAATGKPVAQIDWEGDLGEMESTTTSFPNETTTIVSQYKLFPTRFARGRRITCVVKHPALEKDIRYSFILDIQYAPEVSVTGYDGNWFVGRKGVNLKCNADANPPPFKSVWSRLDGQWPDGLLASDNTLHFVQPLTFNYSGVYVCKVTNSLGQRSDQKVIYISDPPTTTTLQPTVQWHSSTADIEDLATEPKKLPFPLSTLATIKDDTIGTIIASVVGGALFIVLVSVLAGIFCYRRRRTFRGDYFAKNYIPPSDMQKESQIDVLQQDELDSYPDSVKKENKNPVNNLIRKDYLEEPEKTQWNNVENLTRFERPMDYYEDLKMGMKFVNDERYDENEDDLVSHVDGSVISRREWYV
ncbi:nectin-3 isoform X1 [Meriones unguiculatus]|uniref:nectin-3 isoform X1 n=1 Tax=Meriones unguiculatus TaxID=10047 RepID=UPI000B4F10DB|nr:nectin-3 isoform X1 [Meriones unguiculatus]XP_055449774.1 nectin-3 isoform X2 [Psammomys obesus]